MEQWTYWADAYLIITAFLGSFIAGLEAEENDEGRIDQDSIRTIIFAFFLGWALLPIGLPAWAAFYLKKWLSRATDGESK